MATEIVLSNIDRKVIHIFNILFTLHEYVHVYIKMLLNSVSVIQIQQLSTKLDALKLQVIEYSNTEGAAQN